MPMGTLAASAAQCPVAADKTSCQITLTATTEDVTSAEVTDGDGKRYAVTLNTAATLQVDLKPGEEQSFSPSYGGTAATEEVFVAGVCATGVYLDNRSAAPVCRAVLRYENTAYGESNQTVSPVRFQGDTCATMTVEFSINATPFQVNSLYNIPVGACVQHVQPLPSGRVLMTAMVGDKNGAREFFVINPVTNVYEQYGGEEGPAPDLDDPGWIDVSVSGDYASGIGKSAETDAWVVYVSRTDGRTAYCKDKATGNTRTLPSVLEADGKEAAGYRSFISYRN
jgi:hypothetical protein